MKYFLYNCFFLIIIVLFSYINSIHSIEHFTPKIRQFFRPYMRSARVIGEGFYNKTSTNIYNLFRKFGIM
jgi:hypothetical protein